MISETENDRKNVRARARRAKRLSDVIIDELETELKNPVAIVTILCIAMTRYYLRIYKKEDIAHTLSLVKAAFVSAKHMEDGAIK
jgi:hypothetical protein